MGNQLLYYSTLNKTKATERWVDISDRIEDVHFYYELIYLLYKTFKFKHFTFSLHGHKEQSFPVEYIISVEFTPK